MTMVRFRRNHLFPRQVSDIGAFLFVSFMIPCSYFYETLIVVPSLYSQSSVMFYIHNLLGIFILMNLLGNFLGLWLIDTSTRFVVLPTVIRKKWNFCAACEAVTPPRSFHCSVCNTCILKREHHCMFVGYCVGHRNHRYFCLFLFYMFISVAYCTYFNTSFLHQQILLDESGNLTWAQIFKFVFPLVMLITGLDFSWLQFYIFFWSVHTAALLLTGVLLIYHAHLVLRGRTTFENNRRINTYNIGAIQNLKEVFGENWKVILINPFMKSKLPHDGMEWDTYETWKNNHMYSSPTTTSGVYSDPYSGSYGEDDNNRTTENEIPLFNHRNPRDWMHKRAAYCNNSSKTK
ncbi:ZDHHC [Lepeophtheirus salmonis]|uniref:Palmitoyltransferase n=1 Tax=Lepeophtheirus salmonis TaxID=72036 RepID=A0A7R8HDF9_LEPSM|nr:ZDHHC [Lepeophtheirus salmonis]CAF3025618.1 ZDHHC [Lepeophtheirus salmonis]